MKKKFFFFLKIPLTIVSKTIKFLGINLTKVVKHLKTENCNILKEEIHKEEEDTKGELSHVQMGRLNIVQMHILLKGI